MEYYFTINEYIDPRSGKEKSNPLVHIENSENYGWFFIDEIQNLSLNLPYLKEVVTKLQTLMSGEINFYEGFGFENYLIECDRNEARVINLMENDTVESQIPLIELYELVRDWYFYVINFSKTFS